MIKTSLQIESDFYIMLKGSALGKALRGKVYRDGTRPQNVVTEDAVIAFLTGTDSQMQTGIVVMNVFVPTIAVGIRDSARLEELEQLIHQFVWDNDTNYSISTEQSPHIEQIDDKRQTCLTARFRFYHMTN